MLPKNYRGNTIVNPWWLRRKRTKKRTSNGNAVNVKFNSDGLNVNNWNPDKPNPNIGVCSSRQFQKQIKALPNGGAFIKFPPDLLIRVSVCGNFIITLQPLITYELMV